jgi:hypothetical protein
MKQIFLPIQFTILFFLTLLNSQLLAKERPKYDPIRFDLTTTASHIATNEEFELKITASYIILNPNLVYVFQGSNSFRLKLIAPEGFIQTGGTYSDLIGTELTSSNPKVSYTVKGKFTTEVKGGSFQLLRGNKNATNESNFALVGKLNFSTISPMKGDSANPENARISAVIQDYVPHMSLAQFRSGMADTSKVIYINEGSRSGIFQFKPGDTSSPDDTSMILVQGSRRYYREELGFLRPEWFGAVVNDGNDDASAIQKALNLAGKRTSTIIKFGQGTYNVNRTLTGKLNKPGTYNYKLTLEGAGAAVTIIKGNDSSFSGNLIEFLPTGLAGPDSDVNSYIIVKDIQFFAGKANRIIYHSLPIGISLRDNWFNGGEIECIRLGEVNQHNYSIEVLHNYFIGVTHNGSNNLALAHFLNSRFVLVDGNDSDAGKYGFWFDMCDMAFVTNNKIEGSKTAALYFTGASGGENKISSNHINPYVGFEPDGNFSGEIHGIWIKADGTGLSNNTITNNIINVEGLGVIPQVGKVSSKPAGLILSTGGDEHKVVGQTSGATAVPLGFNDADTTIVLMSVTGTFIPGETLVQNTTTTTHVTMVLKSLLPNHSYGIRQTGGAGSNVIYGNQFRLNPEYGISVSGEGNVINSNVIEANLPLNILNNATVVGNKLYSTGTYSAVVNPGLAVKFSTNTYNKPLSGISDPSYLPLGGGTVTGATTFSGTVKISSLPVYSDNTAAASLPVGTLYRTATGEIKVKY